MNITVKVPESSEMSLILAGNNGTQNVTLGMGSHTLRFLNNTSSYSLDLSSPVVDCKGITSFGYLYAAKPFDVYIPGFSTNITGETHFKILAAGRNIELTNLTIAGGLDIQHEDVETMISTELQSVWSNVFFVPIMSGILILILLCFIITRDRMKRVFERVTRLEAFR